MNAYYVMPMSSLEMMFINYLSWLVFPGPLLKPLFPISGGFDKFAAASLALCRETSRRSLGRRIHAEAANLVSF